jgi:hypothetical protein
MKNSCQFFIFLLLFFIPHLICTEVNDDYKLVKIKKVYSEEDPTTRVYNPVTGMDYWETRKLYKGMYQDWTVEFEGPT